MVKEKKAKDKKSKKKKHGHKKKPKVQQPKPFDCAGFTNTDPPRVFRSLAEFWTAFPADSWYPSGASYWDKVTQNVLLKCFETVELVEQCPAFLERAARDLPTVERVCCGLEKFDPLPGTFDVIWVQWVTGHLRDEDFVPFVERAVRGLALGGALVIKDNTSSGDELNWSSTNTPSLYFCTR